MNSKLWLSGLSFSVLAGTSPLWAKRSSELIYTEPFDLAAGGTTLTRASQEGIVFANPALLPLGAATIRWLGFQAGLILDRSIAENGGSTDSGASEEAGEAESGDEGESGAGSSADKFFDRSLHAGQTATISFLNQNFAFTVFDRIEADVEGSRFGDGGLPGIELGIEAYAGALTSLALRPVRWFSIGGTAKYLFLGEPQIMIPIANQEKIQSIVDNPESLQGDLHYGKGAGLDVGTLFLWQNHTIDLSMGLKVEDLGGTRISNGEDPLPQTVHAGLGLAIHGTTEVLHLSLDYRDALGAYATERTFKKVYAGARLMIRQRIGLAAGLYHGIPTVGLRLDASLLKVGLTAYGRELGAYPGQKQRNMLMLYTSMGI